MKLLTLSLTAILMFVGALAPVAGAVDFDELRRENRDKSAVDFDELRRQNRDKSVVDFDELRRQNRDKSAVDTFFTP